MNKLTKAIYFTLLSIFVVFTGCSPQASSQALPWKVYQGQFYTRDFERAQAEIPFTIVLPKYLPGKPHNILPEINGPLKEYQHDNRVEVIIDYPIDLGGEKTGLINIIENNYPVFPPDPALDTDVEFIEISGICMVKSTNKVNPVQFFFNHNEIYFHVQFYHYNLPIEEAVKVIASMVE